MTKKETFESQQKIEDLCFDVLETIENILEFLHPGETFEDVIYGFKREDLCVNPGKNTLMTLKVEMEICPETKNRLSGHTEHTTYVMDSTTDQKLKITGTYSNQIIKALGNEKADKLACSIVDSILKV